MIELKNIKPGDRVKSELRAISCATGEDNKQAEWKHWWNVVKVDDETISVSDGENEMFFDRSGRGFMPNTNHFIYKIKTS